MARRERLSGCCLLWFFGLIGFCAEGSGALSSSNATAGATIEIRLEKARDLAKAGKIPDATSILLGLAQEAPTDPRPWALIAALRRAAGHPEGSIEAAVRSLEIAPTPNAFNVLTLTFLDQGDANTALEMAERSLNLDPGQAELLLRVADAFQKMNLLRYADRVYQQCLEIDPESIRAREVYAVFLLANGENDRLLQCVEGIEERDHENGLARMIRGRLAFLSGETKKSVRLLQESSANSPDPALASLYLGEALLASGSAEEAEVHLEHALGSPSHEAKACFALARLSRQTGKTDQARYYARRFADLQRRRKHEESSSDTERMIRAAEAASQEGDFAKAARILEPSIMAGSGMGALHLNYATYLIRCGSVEAARPHLCKGETLNPFAYRSFSDLGFALYEAGEPALARSCWEKSLLISATSDPPLMGLWRAEVEAGGAYLREKGIPEEEARNFLDLARRTMAGDKKARDELESFSRAEVPDPLEGLAHFYWAFVRGLEGDPGAGLDELQACAEIFGYSRKLRFYAMLYLRRDGQVKEADAMYRFLGLSWMEPVCGESG